MIRRVRTLLIKVDPVSPRREDIRVAAEVIRKGGLVAFPTETVYGLGANAFDSDAVRLVFEVKGRPPDNPLIVHVATLDRLSAVTATDSPDVSRLVSRFWPGPLTLVVPRSRYVPDIVTAGLDTVAVRMPRNEVALALIGEAGVPIAAPSANLSGRPSPTKAEHVLDDFDGLIEVVLDGGPTEIGIESTVLDVSKDPPLILRPGGISLEELRGVLPDVKVSGSPANHGDEGLARSPGMRHLHYRPRANLVLVEYGSEAELDSREYVEKILKIAQGFLERGMKIGIIASEENAPFYCRLPGAIVRVLGSRADLDSMGAKLYDELRQFDLTGVNVIVAEGYPEKGIGLALMNRLRRAASKIIRNGEESPFEGEGEG